MILKENEISTRKILKILGEQSKRKERFKIIGSNTYYLKTFISISNVHDCIKPNSRCIIEKFDNGCLIWANYSNSVSAIPVVETELVKIVLIKGDERVRPIPFTPMWILLKLGVPIRIARYFRVWIYEYYIKQMKLSIQTTNYNMTFVSNGYSFEQQQKFFESWHYGDKIVIKK